MPWYIEGRSTNYADPLRRTGQIDAYINPTLPVASAFESRGGPEQGPRPASQWVGWMYVQRPDPATTGGVDTRIVCNFAAFPSIIGLWMCSIVVVAGLFLMVEKWRGRRPRMVWAAVLASTVAVGINVWPESHDPPPSTTVRYVRSPDGRYPIVRGAAVTGLRQSESDPLEMLNAAEIAARILAAVRAANEPTEGRLVVFPTSPAVVESASTTWYPSRYSFVRYSEIPYVGVTNVAPPGPLLPPWRWRIWSFDRETTVAWIGPGDMVRQATISWAPFFVVASGFLLIACWRIWFVWPYDAWRSRRRIRRGECPECGHPQVQGAVRS